MAPSTPTRGSAPRGPFVVATIIQIGLAVAAFWDLARRDAEGVSGPKPAWIPVILVNWIGPAVYFIFGIRR